VSGKTPTSTACELSLTPPAITIDEGKILYTADDRQYRIRGLETNCSSMH
jgi:hypothetical protein